MQKFELTSVGLHMQVSVGEITEAKTKAVTDAFGDMVSVDASAPVPSIYRRNPASGEYVFITDDQLSVAVSSDSDIHYDENRLRDMGQKALAALMLDGKSTSTLFALSCKVPLSSGEDACAISNEFLPVGADKLVAGLRGVGLRFAINWEGLKGDLMFEPLFAEPENFIVNLRLTTDEAMQFGDAVSKLTVVHRMLTEATMGILTDGLIGGD